MRGIRHETAALAVLFCALNDCCVLFNGLTAQNNI